MLSKPNSVGWMGESEEQQDSSLTWHTNQCNNNNLNLGAQNTQPNVVDNNNNNNTSNNNSSNNHVEVDVVSLKSMLDVENDWYNSIQNSITFSTTPNDNLLLNQIDSSSSCSPSPCPSVFNSTITPLDPSHLPFLFSSKPSIFNNPLSQSFGLSCGPANGLFPDTQNQIYGGFTEFSPHDEMGSPNLGPNPHFSTPHLVHLGGNDGFNGSRFRGFDQGLGNSVFMNRGSKLLKPLDNSTPVGAQPTLFQKRAALRKNVGFDGRNNSVNLLNSGGESSLISNRKGDNNDDNNGGENEKKRNFSNVGFLDNVSIDGSAFNYDSDDFTDNNNFTDSAKNGGANSNNNSTVTGGGGDVKGKKKGLPAKNLMAERRRRKKLNDRLYMLRSVVPKISKMDRASILGDAIEYLKELLQKINDLHNELESTPPPSLTPTTNFHPLTPTLPNLPSRIKEELCPSSLPSPSGQPARIEVRLREGRAVNIHMFCGRRPGLLLSTMRALDGLGLDIQQAVISCFNGFAMDIFRAEQCNDGQDLHPDQIKALLLDLATYHGSTVSGNCNM